MYGEQGQQIDETDGGQSLGASSEETEGTIFVGGLSWQTTEDSMRLHFEKFGVLSDLAIKVDKRNRQPR